MLDHIARIILDATEEHLEGEFHLVCKWGFDGSSGQSLYKQGWEHEMYSDESAFVTSLVSLKLMGKNSEAWKNHRPSSTLFCRPIRLRFVKETKDVIKRAEKCIQSQIDQWKTFKTEAAEIQFSLQLAMIVGQVLCALTNTSTQQCPICKQTARGSSSWTESKSADEAALSLAFHCSTPTFDSWNLSWLFFYRLGKATKHLEMVTILMCGINKRNTSELKEDACLFTKIAQSKDLDPQQRETRLKDFSPTESQHQELQASTKNCVILFALSSGHDINIGQFETYCRVTKALYKELYSGYEMTPTIHKVLENGSLIIRSAVTQSGQLSEEAQESRNKDIRNYRQFFVRKSSRLHIRDLFCRLILSSDPVISSARRLPRKSVHNLPEEIRNDLNLMIISEQCEGDTDAESCRDDTSDESNV